MGHRAAGATAGDDDGGEEVLLEVRVALAHAAAQPSCQGEAAAGTAATGVAKAAAATAAALHAVQRQELPAASYHLLRVPCTIKPQELPAAGEQAGQRAGKRLT